MHSIPFQVMKINHERSLRMLNIFKVIEGDTETVLFNRDNAEKKETKKPNEAKKIANKAILFGLLLFPYLSTGIIDTLTAL